MNAINHMFKSSSLVSVNPAHDVFFAQAKCMQIWPLLCLANALVMILMTSLARFCVLGFFDEARTCPHAARRDSGRRQRNTSSRVTVSTYSPPGWPGRPHASQDSRAV